MKQEDESDFSEIPIIGILGFLFIVAVGGIFLWILLMVAVSITKEVL